MFDAVSTEGDLVPPATYSNIFMAFQGVLPGPGNHTATLLANGGQQYQALFGLDQMPAPPMPTSLLPGMPSERLSGLEPDIMQQRLAKTLVKHKLGPCKTLKTRRGP